MHEMYLSLSSSESHDIFILPFTAFKTANVESNSMHLSLRLHFTQFLHFIAYKYKVDFDKLTKDLQEFSETEKDNLFILDLGPGLVSSPAITSKILIIENMVRIKMLLIWRES